MLTTLLALAASVLPIEVAPGPAADPPTPHQELAAQDDARFTASPTHLHGSRAFRRKRYPLRGKGFTRAGLPRDPLEARMARLHQDHGSRAAWAARRHVGTAIGHRRFDPDTGRYCPKETAMFMRRRELWKNADPDCLLTIGLLGGGSTELDPVPDRHADLVPKGELYVPLHVYAAAVGMTTGGARARCLRGSIDAHKQDGQWYVSAKEMP